MGRLLLGAAYSAIEPLGLLHLAGLARDEGWDRKVALVKDHDYEDFYRAVKDYKPDVVGFNVYTGNHIQLFEAFQRIKKDNPGIQLALGGPHPTYFPSEALEHSDYVVMSEGFAAMRSILRGEAKPGILVMRGKFPGTLASASGESFPMPDRETFYADYPEHADSPIKSVITMTGCPYKCTYCYNSSTADDIADNMPSDIAEVLASGMGLGGRLFPRNVRSVDDVVAEGIELAERWNTKLVYMQDDVHGFDVKDWMPKFAKEWKEKTGLPYHAQIRWEMTKNDERLDIIREAGATGLTLAIEAADPHIRKEVLDRGMPEELIFEGMQKLMDRGLTVRTEQITGLPYGATTYPTRMNLDADLELLELNVRLREVTGGPTMAWASTLAPYAGTKLGAYCERYGHFETSQNSDIPDTFFDRSVMRFPNRWVGPELANMRDDPSVWLSDHQLETYRDQNAELRRNFNFFALMPAGHELARSYLTSAGEFSFRRLGRETVDHLKSLSGEEQSGVILERIRAMRATHQDSALVQELAPIFAALPKHQLAVERFLKYLREQNKPENVTLSTAVRHHLYDNVLYDVGRKDKGLFKSL